MKFFVIYICFIILYAISNKINEDYEILNNNVMLENNIINKVFDNELIRHYEIDNDSIIDFILYSNVCILGKITFYAWVIVPILIYLYGNSWLSFFTKYFYYGTILLTLVMNLPLFIRSIPAFYLLHALLLCLNIL